MRPNYLSIAIAILALASSPASYSKPIDHPLVLPEGGSWTLLAEFAGSEQTFLLPADLPKIKALPKADRDKLLLNIKRIESNQKHVREISRQFFDAVPKPGDVEHRLTPEYDRTLTEAIISISSADTHNPKPLARHEPILRALPTYTHIRIVLPAPALANVRKTLGELGLSKRATLYPLEEWNKKKPITSRYTRQSRWIRDAFLVGADAGGNLAAFVPLSYASLTVLTRNDLDFVHDQMYPARQVLHIPGFLRGGNLAVADSWNGLRRVFVGEIEILNNEKNFIYSTGMTPPPALIPEVLKKIVGTSDVTVLPNTDKLFHIDMALNFLAPGIAALIAPLDEEKLEPADRQVLITYRRKLAEKGFRVINVPTTAARVNSFRSPVNALPFVNRDTGRRTVIVPRFEDETVMLESRQQSLNAAIRSAYEREGFDVIFAEDRFSDRWGNVHCVMIAAR